MENRTYKRPFSSADVVFLLKSMNRFLHLSEIVPDTPRFLLVKHTYIAVNVLIHNLLRLSGYYDYNRK